MKKTINDARQKKPIYRYFFAGKMPFFKKIFNVIRLQNEVITYVSHHINDFAADPA